MQLCIYSINRGPDYHLVSRISSQPSLCINTQLYNLIDSRVLWTIQPILLQNALGQESPTEEMSAREILHAGLRRSQTDQRLRHELSPRSFLGGTCLDIPRTRCIDTQNRNRCRLHLQNDGGEWLAEWTAEGKPEYGVDDEIG